METVIETAKTVRFKVTIAGTHKTRLPITRAIVGRSNKVEKVAYGRREDESPALFSKTFAEQLAVDLAARWRMRDVRVLPVEV